MSAVEHWSCSGSETSAFDEVPLVWRLSSPDDVFEALSHGGVRTAAILRAQTPEALTAIQRAVRSEVETYARDDAS